MSTSQGRKRSRLACETCRDLKRKCDGAQPCGACVRFEYDCTYKTFSNKKRKTHEATLLPSPPVHTEKESRPSRSDHATSPRHLQSLEANSGAAFLRRLALRLDPKNAPRMHTFSWNAFLGARKSSHVPVSRPITDLLSKEDMESLSAVYFQKMDPIYGFVDRDDISQTIQVEPPPVELDLIETARFILEQKMSDGPSAASVTGWLLRVVYLRIAGTPHTAWMASSILMHMLEAAGLHCEPSQESVLPVTEEKVDAELRRRLFAVAEHLNIWISFDMGRSRTILCNSTLEMPCSREGDYTHELMELLPYSTELDPNKTQDVSELEASLSTVLSRTHSVPPSIMAQTNLALCLCRRLQSMNTTFSGKVLDQILSITKTGIEAAQAILDARSPWHHMANVPFQIICVLLAIDTGESIAQLKDAMQCLSNVATVYNTNATKEALNTASLLILMQQRRKEKCASNLSDILKTFPIVSLPETRDETPVTEMDDMRWLNNLVGDLSSFDYADLDRFLFPNMF
ncbi:protein RDR1 [Fusarium oxysporum f. sp. raphani 54005]|uniref:Protein RDR1 n=1 Tax=Fusarium oxysporum f. sp. raphani 54005 TaxID=1089458 RepID=X0CZP5_FUSOX|nr:protein RDR1 [Fusarium oxysporum f. sp. raphani 54005]